VLDRKTYAELDRIRLSLLSGFDRKLKGMPPVSSIRLSSTFSAAP
jgi:hypothetical protein